jgi:pimeloyl-ACP methyl ester carboxylesterase
MIIDTNGVKLALSESGSGQPLLLMHGANTDRHQFDWFRPFLANGVRAIAYDQRDTPQYPSPESYTMEDHAKDAADVIARLCGSSAHVFGTSYGGAVAMTLAALYPERVKSLILGATAPSMSKFCVPDVASVAAAGEQAVKRFMLELFFTPTAIEQDIALMDAVRASSCERSAEANQRRMGALAGHDLQDHLHGIKAPTLVLHGVDDPIITLQTSQELAAAIPGAHLIVLPGIRHAVSMEQAERTAKIVSEFVLANS